MANVSRIINGVLTGAYAASAAALTLLTDENVISAKTAADIGVIIVTFAAGYHGSQAVNAVTTNKPAA